MYIPRVRRSFENEIQRSGSFTIVFKYRHMHTDVRVYDHIWTFKIVFETQDSGDDLGPQ